MMAGKTLTAAGTRAFSSPKAWAAWLKREHARADGLWVRFYKKASGVKSLTYAQALDEALCWGWIDGQAKPLDADSWLQRYTPRRRRSAWSKRNREHVARLMAEDRMQPAGLAQVAAAKADGRWERAYDGPAASTIPDDLLAALGRHPRALAFFNGLNKSNRYAISYRLQTAKKPETRQRRFDAILEMLKRGEAFH
jgi:uncharacterized protein YdeI (YjbR/CyaY-like superfamily)